MFLAPVCSSWCWVARGSTRRSISFPGGDSSRQSVADGNCMVSRSGSLLHQNTCANMSARHCRVACCQFVSHTCPCVWRCWGPRVILLCILALHKGAQIMIEQPQGSLMQYHSRWRWFVNEVVPFYRVRFPMRRFGARSQKPTVLYGNSEAMLQEVLEAPPSQTAVSDTIATTRVYVDRTGRRRCTGIKKNLKESQCAPRPSLAVVWMWAFVR